MDTKSLIEICDLELRQGRAGEGIKRLSTLNLNTVAREHRLPLAAISRRANLFTIGLKLLTPLIYKERNKWLDEANPLERSEYAALLSKNGNNSEAIKILRAIPESAVPEASLYLAFCHMANWNYREAEAELTRYLEGQPERYSAAIARVNLGACLVSTADWSDASDLLLRNIEEARSHGFHRLHANNLELRAQLSLRRRNLKTAREDLEQASRLLGADKTSDSLFVRKWQAILEGFETKSEQPILEFRKYAAERGHWESMRDADRFSLMIRHDQRRFEHLFFGTPFASFRAQLALEFGGHPTAEVFQLGAVDSTISLNLRTGAFSQAPDLVLPAKHLRLITILTEDFYRPIQIGALFSQLFPNDHFDIYSSPNRVYQTLWRVRSWVQSLQLPIAIRQYSGNYRVTLGKDCALLVPLERHTEHARWIEAIRERFAGAEFTAGEACSALTISRSDFLRRSKDALHRGHLLKRFHGPATRYRVAWFSS